MDTSVTVVVVNDAGKVIYYSSVVRMNENLQFNGFHCILFLKSWIGIGLVLGWDGIGLAVIIVHMKFQVLKFEIVLRKTFSTFSFFNN